MVVGRKSPPKQSLGGAPLKVEATRVSPGQPPFVTTIFAPLIRLQPQGRTRWVWLMALEQDQRISEVVKREQSRLRNFIRSARARPARR
jgi:hypothetical protein